LKQHAKDRLLQAFQRNKQVTNNQSDQIQFVQNVSRVARGNWFALIAAMAFFGVTLLSAKDIDFFESNAKTKLPALGIEVPTELFFAYSPIILLLLYGFFHVYLIKLWAGLMGSSPVTDGKLLGDVIPPWLVSDMGLTARVWLRRGTEEDCKRTRELDWLAALLTFVFTWLFGLTLLSGFWLRTLAVEQNALAVMGAIILSIAFYIGFESFRGLYVRARVERSPSSWTKATTPSLFAIFVALGTWFQINE